MAFRDDRAAAHARADALARELSAKEEALARKDRELEEARARLAAAEARPAAPPPPPPPPPRDARAALEEVKARAAVREAAREQARAATRARDDDEAARADAHRLQVSVTAWAGWSWSGFAIFLAVPGFWLTFYATVRYHQVPFLVVPPAVLGLALALAALARWRAQAKVADEYAWAATRAYQLDGYPALLAVKPRSLVDDRHRALRERMDAQLDRQLGRARDPADDGDGRAADGGDHSYVLLTLRFDGSEPPELDRVLAGFDDTLVRRPSGRFRGTSPVTPSRSGMSTEDTNAAVRAWVRRLDADVLAPLAAAHGLAHVTLELR